MEQQQNEPNAAHQVIYISHLHQPNLKDEYKIKAATVLGVIHIICGFLAFLAEINRSSHDFSIVSPLGFTAGFTAALSFVTGGVAIGGARSGNEYMMVLTLVMAIVSAIFAGILLVLSAILLDSYSYSLLIAMSATMLISATHMQTSLLLIRFTTIPTSCPPAPTSTTTPT